LTPYRGGVSVPLTPSASAHAGPVASAPTHAPPPVAQRPGDRPAIVVSTTSGSETPEPFRPAPTSADPAAKPERPVETATTYRATRRPGLTTPGVAVLSTAVGLVFAVLSILFTGGLGWLFAVPFVLVSGYCAWEVRPSDQRAALLAPPLTLFVVAVVHTVFDHGLVGPRPLTSGVVTVLASAAPMLVAAVALSAALLLFRHLRAR